MMIMRDFSPIKIYKNMRKILTFLYTYTLPILVGIFTLAFTDNLWAA